MADEKTYTKAELDAAIEKAVETATGDVEGLKAKVEELIGDNKRLKIEARKAKEIDPAEVERLHAENEELQGKLTAAEKAAKEALKAKEAAEKALETETGAARAYAMEAEVSSAIAAGNILPALVPAFKAMVMQHAKAELADGKYVVTIGDKPAKDYVESFLGTDEGKAFKAAAVNGGGGAMGGTDKAGGKTMSRSAFDALGHVERAAFAKDGGKVVDEAA